MIIRMCERAVAASLSRDLCKQCETVFQFACYQVFILSISN